MRLSLWRTNARLTTPIVASLERHDERPRLFLRVEHDGVEGFGEVDPQPRALNGDPGVEDVVEELRRVLLPQLFAVVRREGVPPSWTRVARFVSSRSASAPAVTLVEMALFDRELRSGGETLLDRWPTSFDTPLQATTSILGDLGDAGIAPDTARVRVKTAPGSMTKHAREFLERLGRPVLLDFNCSASTDDDVVQQVMTLTPFVAIVGVEQPYASGNVVDHARLAQRLDVPLSIDEGLRSVRDLEQIVRYDAARVVCVKPARVGGYANARTIIARAKELGLRPYLGGFFESELARSVNRTLAQHLVSEPSDIGPVGTQSSDQKTEFVEDSAGFGLLPTAEFLEEAVLVETLGV